MKGAATALPARDSIAPGNPVDAAILSRRSIRAFKPDAVDESVIRHLLEVAARAPSGTNTQPWNAYVVSGAARDRLCARILEAYRSDEPHEFEYSYYPTVWRDPYISRRRKNGWSLYGLLGIEKGDREKMRDQHARNYVFFDAPVGLIFTIDRDLEIGSWLDFGMYLQSFMIAARGHGLDTCAQQAFAQYHKIIHPRLGIPETQMIVCGMALGYADQDAVVNRLVTEREPVEVFARFIENFEAATNGQ